MDMTEDQMKKALGEIDPVPQDKFVIDTTMASQVVLMTLEQLDHNPELPPHYVLFFCTKGFVQSACQQTGQPVVPEAVFSYYIKTYQAVIGVKDNLPPTNDPAIVQSFMTKAALHLFDVYLDVPTDTMVRRCLLLAASALRDIALQQHARMEHESSPIMMQQLTNLTMMTEQLPIYLKGLRRKSNLPYIRWLGELFEIIMRDPEELDRLIDHDVFKSVAYQVRNKKRTIKLT